MLIPWEPVGSLCSPQVGRETVPAFPSLLPEQPHTFREEPFPKKPIPFLVLEKQAVLWGTGLFCRRGNSHSGVITVLVRLGSHTVLGTPTLSISAALSDHSQTSLLCLRIFSPSKLILESSCVHMPPNWTFPSSVKYQVKQQNCVDFGSVCHETLRGR